MKFDREESVHKKGQEIDWWWIKKFSCYFSFFINGNETKLFKSSRGQYVIKALRMIIVKSDIDDILSHNVSKWHYWCNIFIHL